MLAENEPINPAEKYSKLFVFSGGNKAGMDAMDKEKQAQVIYEMSKNSAFFKRACKLDEAADQKAENLKRMFNEVQGSAAQRLKGLAESKTAEYEKQRCLRRICCVLDMDMFYAAVEIRDQPHLKDLPVAVGGTYMISTSNYVARKYGVRAAMPGFIAKKLCPQLVFVSCNFDKYKIVAEQIRDVIKEYDPNYHSWTYDEVYFDLTDVAEERYRKKTGYLTHHTDPNSSKLKREDTTSSCNDVDEEDDEEYNDDHLVTQQKKNSFIPIESLRLIAVEILQEIRERIQTVTGGLTSSAGIANNFFLAKIGADINKPNGQYELPPTRQGIYDFLTTLPTRKVGGIGKVMEKLLSKLNINTVGDIREHLPKLLHVFTPVTGDFLLRISMGIAKHEGHEEDSYNTTSSSSTSVEDAIGRKSIGCERTYTAKGLESTTEILEKLHELCIMVHKELVEHQLIGKTVTLKLKDTVFNLYTRSQTHSHYIQSIQDIEMIGRELLQGLMPKKIRLLGINISKLQQQSNGNTNTNANANGTVAANSGGGMNPFHGGKLQKSMLEYCNKVSSSSSKAPITEDNKAKSASLQHLTHEECEIMFSQEVDFDEVEDVTNLASSLGEENEDEETEEQAEAEEIVDMIIGHEESDTDAPSNSNNNSNNIAHSSSSNHNNINNNAYDMLMIAAAHRDDNNHHNNNNHNNHNKKRISANTLFSAANKKRSSHEPVQGNGNGNGNEDVYLCPICQISIIGNLELFNTHIDNCLLAKAPLPPSSSAIAPVVDNEVIVLDSQDTITTTTKVIAASSSVANDNNNNVNDGDVQIWTFLNDQQFVLKTDYDLLLAKYHELLLLLKSIPQ